MATFINTPAHVLRNWRVKKSETIATSCLDDNSYKTSHFLESTNFPQVLIGNHDERMTVAHDQSNVSIPGDPCGFRWMTGCTQAAFCPVEFNPIQLDKLNTAKYIRAPYGFDDFLL